MEKDRGFKIMAVIALLVAVAGLSFAYAAYSSTLKISGSGVVNKTQWDIHFENLSPSAVIVGKGVSATEPTLAATTISGFKATLNAPGDSVAYTFDVKNTGTLPASLSTYTLGGLTCAPADSTANQEQATAICKDLTYTLNYTGASAVAQSDTLDSGETKNLTLKIEWKSSSTAQTPGNINVTIGETTLTYTQA